MVSMLVGEVCNFSAYAFAPAILVTPLGALSVLIGAVLGSYFLGEQLGILGRVGCATCLIGSVVIVLHAPPDRELRNVGELLHYALMPGMLRFYQSSRHVLTIAAMYRLPFLLRGRLCLRPRHDLPSSATIRQEEPNDLYLHLQHRRLHLHHGHQRLRHSPQLTLGGRNQFGNPSTYVFAIVVVVCILTQMNYFNKALSQFSTNM